MGGMMAPVYLILGVVAAVLAIPFFVGLIAVVTHIGRAMGF